MKPDFETVVKAFQKWEDASSSQQAQLFEKAARELVGTDNFEKLMEWQSVAPEFKETFEMLFNDGVNEQWQFETIQEITADAEPLNWIIEGLLLADTGTLVSGHPHCGKSFSWLAAAIDSVSHGKVWGEFQSKAKRVLYIETEDPKQLVADRIRSLRKGLPPGTLAEGFHIAVTGPFDIVNSEAALNDLVDRVKPDWLVLSTLQSVLNGRDFKSQKDMGPVNAQLVRLSRKCPLVVLTHSPWDKEAKRAAGSVTQAANFATTLHFEKSGSIIKVTVDSKMSGSEKPFKLEMETEDVVTDTGTVKSEVRRIVYEAAGMKDRIREYYRDNPGAKPADVAKALDCSDRYARECQP